MHKSLAFERLSDIINWTFICLALRLLPTLISVSKFHVSIYVAPVSACAGILLITLLPIVPVEVRKYLPPANELQSPCDAVPDD